WATDRAQVLAPSTLRKLVSTLQSIYSAAVLDRLVGSSPVVQLTLPAAHRERIVPLTVDQVRALAESMAPKYRAMVYVQAGLGLRVGELLGLQVQNCDFLGRSVRIDHQADRDTGEMVPPKTRQSRRTIPMPKVVANELAAHLAAFPASPTGLLFHTATDRPYHQAFYGSQVFAPAVEKAKLPAGSTSHDLRHHYASVLLAAGESVVAVAERLGHENATLVLRVYGHLVPGSEERTRKAIDTAWDPPSADSVRTGRSS
ncbi:site-specific integrase, partial [Pseudonocardia sp.]|uniref:tyrosine-type recombinase/integrase n=1 Tax=Pseudonocardia sp. TaxID=60912 RepID=UPI002616865C